MGAFMDPNELMVYHKENFCEKRKELVREMWLEGKKAEEAINNNEANNRPVANVPFRILKMEPPLTSTRDIPIISYHFNGMVPCGQVSETELVPVEIMEYRYENKVYINHNTEDKQTNTTTVLTPKINKLNTASKPPKENIRTLKHQQQSKRKKGDGQLQFIENIGITKK